MLLKSDLAGGVTKVLEGVIGDTRAILHEPVFGGNEWTYVKECLDTTFVSSVGKFVDRFELELANYTASKHAVAVASGTAALHIALRLAGVGTHDEVLMPALTFVATGNAALYCGAVPHFVEVDAATLGVDPIALREYLRRTTVRRGGECVNTASNRPIRALVPMHTFGHPADIVGLVQVANDFGIALVEDAAESLGSTVDGRHAGTFGLMGTISFNGNKTITTGGGGAVLTDDEDLARRAKHLTTTAKLPHPWHYRHDQVGYNYRMPNINAALGCAQLEQLDSFLKSKRALFESYKSAFAGLSGVEVVAEPGFARSNYWLQSLILDDEVAHERDAILQATNDAGFMTRPVWTPLHRLGHFESCPRMDLATTESLERRLINLPSSAFLGVG